MPVYPRASLALGAHVLMLASSWLGAAGFLAIIVVVKFQEMTM